MIIENTMENRKTQIFGDLSQGGIKIRQALLLDTYLAPFFRSKVRYHQKFNLVVFACYLVWKMCYANILYK